jgi:hypothetical protein
MCGISASFNLNKLTKIIKLNNYRGSFSYSFLVYDTKENNIVALHRSFEDCRYKLINHYKKINNNDYYYISHCQAPTSGLIRKFENIHPAEYQNNYLYHNGMLSEISIQALSIINNKLSWDTNLLLRCIINSDFNDLHTIEGSYAAVLITPFNGIKIFRNSNSIIYYDNDLSLSSSQYKSMKILEVNKIFSLDFTNKKLKFWSKFNSPDNSFLIL